MFDEFGYKEAMDNPWICWEFDGVRLFRSLIYGWFHVLFGASLGTKTLSTHVAGDFCHPLSTTSPLRALGPSRQARGKDIAIIGHGAFAVENVTGPAISAGGVGPTD